MSETTSSGLTVTIHIDMWEDRKAPRPFPNLEYFFGTSKKPFFPEETRNLYFLPLTNLLNVRAIKKTTRLLHQTDPQRIPFTVP